MDSLRRLIQETLDVIPDVDCGAPFPDDMIEDGQTYFGYTLNQDYIDEDFDGNYSMQITLSGHLVRKNNNVENTLSIMDSALEELLEALKSLHFKYSYEDVSLNDNVRKIHVTGVVRYNEINNWLI